MSDKFCNIMRLLLLLRRGKYSARVLAEELGVDERTVRYYIGELENAHVFVKSTKGRYGGYSIGSEYDGVLNLALSAQEKNALEMGRVHLESSNYLFLKEYRDALDKIHTSYSRLKQERIESEGVYVRKATGCALQEEKEREWSREVYEAILLKRKVEIAYYSLHSDAVSVRIVQPYAIFEYNGWLYMTGHCEKREKQLDFKLSRIRKLTLTDEVYTLPSDFDLDTYLQGGIGIYQEEPVQVQLKISHPMSQIVKEKVWVENQEIREIANERAILFSAEVRGYTELKSWVMSMGSQVQVLAPERLAHDIQEEAKKIIESSNVTEGLPT